MCYISTVSTATWCDVSANSWEKAESHAQIGLKVIEISPATSKRGAAHPALTTPTKKARICIHRTGSSSSVCGEEFRSIVIHRELAAQRTLWQHAAVAQIRVRKPQTYSFDPRWLHDLNGCYLVTPTGVVAVIKEQRLRVFENKVLRKIFGTKRDEVAGEWRKLHNAKLHALYSSPDIKSRRLRWAGHVARMSESRNAYRVSVWRSDGKRPLGISRRRWGDNI
ncbi:hypothetical protein ANN_22726 [Periplaneta americana]|uniref:Uncharacterized protein n=1 Tax=Periplaneta americana TaxID=6978 RepID=A0ABQ8SJG0_PERAM|nr:hypothetical protein ANN_22726 [Periplaneta americana]